MTTASEIVAICNAEAQRTNAVQDRWLASVHGALWAAINDPHWSTPLPKPPGIYWTRTGGKTHTVEVVR